MLFYGGSFLLPSALFLGALLLFTSLVIACFYKKEVILKDKWNKPFLVCSLILIFSCLYNQIFINNPEINYWIGLSNLIPLFLGFFAFQFYVDNNNKRYIFATLLISGSIPFFFSCLSQYWLNWSGPYETLNGLIIWFQRSLDTEGNRRGVSGLFSNVNYAGQWLTILFPFSIVLFFKRNQGIFKKLISFLIFALIIYLVFLTRSRNAFLGVLISFPIIFTIKGFIFLAISTLFLVGLIGLETIIDFPSRLKFIIYKITSSDLLGKMLNIFTDGGDIRLNIWRQTISKIINKPIFGWGAGSFSFVAVSVMGVVEITHAHNLPLELAFNYGIPLSLILSSTIISILIKSAKIIYRSKSNFENFLDRAWFSSALVLAFCHLSDVTYYDGRISLTLCILLSGLKNIIDKN